MSLFKIFLRNQIFIHFLSLILIRNYSFNIKIHNENSLVILRVSKNYEFYRLNILSFEFDPEGYFFSNSLKQFP